MNEQKLSEFKVKNKPIIKIPPKFSGINQEQENHLPEGEEESILEEQGENHE